MTERWALDSWAVLALLQGEEPAATRVVGLLRRAERSETQLLMSIINLGEVYYCVGRARGLAEADDILARLGQLPITVVPAGEDAVLAAARLEMSYAISYADAFAAATALRLDATLLTGDPELVVLADLVRIERLQRSRK